jgi:UDP-MurNAc hydroxylase
MKIHFIGHSCLVAECEKSSILMDPWLFGKIFNNSWTLLPEPSLDASLLDKIDYIWISHEHPDHAHFPTLNSFPESFKQRVTILFQNRDHEKMIAAFRQIGYNRFRLLPHREIIPLDAQSDPDTRVYCYHAGLMDSALAILSRKQVLFNGNDARISVGECNLILKDIGHVDVLATQFSIAGYRGYEPHAPFLSRQANRILEQVSATHRGLHTKVTIPFASFIYFSSVDNKYVNPFMSTARDAYGYLTQRNQTAVIMYPGDTYEIGSTYDSSRALERYDALPDCEHRVYDPIESKPFEEIREAYEALSVQIRERFPSIILWMLRPVTVQIPDLDKTIEFRLAKGSLREVDKSTPPDLIVNSQPLWFSFRFPFGNQTLGVTARFRLLRHARNWNFHRIIFAMNNGSICLRPKYLLKSDTLRYVESRMSGGLRQSIHYYRSSL